MVPGKRKPGPHWLVRGAVKPAAALESPIQADGQAVPVLVRQAMEDRKPVRGVGAWSWPVDLWQSSVAPVARVEIGRRQMSIPLPPLPPIRDWPHSHEELRARDLEVARLVLEGAAQAAGPEDSYQDRWFAAKEDAVKRIRALEVKHG